MGGVRSVGAGGEVALGDGDEGAESGARRRRQEGPGGVAREGDVGVEGGEAARGEALEELAEVCGGVVAPVGAPERQRSNAGQDVGACHGHGHDGEEQGDGAVLEGESLEFSDVGLRFHGRLIAHRGGG